jgi:hypothetical protein
MAGDYSRFSFRRERRVSTVDMQQGRVQLDADWNEQAEIVDGRIRNLAHDTWGPSWVSKLTTPDAFKLTAIAGPDLAIGAGRLYAKGLAPEVFPGETPTWRKQPFLPVPQAVPAGTAIAYLHVFERELTWVEEPELLEKALHGVDTATRRQVAWQVKLATPPNATCRMDLDALFPPSAGRLTTQATATPTSDDPCILPPTGGYRGLENRLYRIQVHVPGPVGTAKFKWSRENASIVSPVQAIATSGTKSEVQVLRIGRDAVLRFSPGDWVEVTDDQRELMGQSGDMARVESIDETTRTLFLDRVLPAPLPQLPFGTTPDEHAARHTRVIRWDQSFELHANAVDAAGLMTTGPGPIPLEDGVQALFGADPLGGAMTIDDHWSFEARTVDGSIRELIAAPPDGVRHVYVPLALVTAAAGGGFEVTEDCRNLVPGTSTPPADHPCDCCTLCVGEGGDVPDLKSALAALPGVAPNMATPVRLCLMPGDHDLAGGLDVTRPNTWIVGCYPRSRLLVQGRPLRLAADLTALVDVIVLGGAEPAAVVAARGSDILIRGCSFAIERVAAPAFVADGTERLERLTVLDNDFKGAGIVLSDDCPDVRVEGNRIERCRGNAITLLGENPEGPITILANRLIDGLGNGIEGIGSFAGLRIVGNVIRVCRGEAGVLGKVAGGIALQEVRDLLVRDNRIEGNASDAPDWAGVYVGQAIGAEIAGNRIVGNGRRVAGGNPLAGGIVIDRARPPLDEAGAAHRFDPALVLADNLVIAPRGQALFVIGTGDMRVAGNTFVTELGTARGRGAPGIGVRDLAAVVVIGSPLVGQFAEQVIDLAAVGPEAPRGIQEFAKGLVESSPGRVAVQGNQIALASLDRSGSADPALSAVIAWGYEDVDLSHNQVELDLEEGRICLNALVVARTTRQVGNRLTEPPGREACLASLLSHSHALNTCTQNQGTHCILATTGGKSAISLNLVEVPTDLCREG